jgi:hypothetical protein
MNDTLIAISLAESMHIIAEVDPDTEIIAQDGVIYTDHVDGFHWTDFTENNRVALETIGWVITTNYQLELEL